MRRALVDHVRRRRAQKRGPNRTQVDELEQVAIEDRPFDTLEVEDVLRQLERDDAAAATVAELRLFGGLSSEECARALGLSKRTVERRWCFARAWLVTELMQDGRER